MRDKTRLYSIASLLAWLSIAATARAEDMFSLHIGNAWTRASDVTLTDGSSELKLSDVEWQSKAGEPPPYYSIRYTHFFDQAPGWGFNVDVLHAKMISVLDQDVAVQGNLAGTPVSGVDALGNTFTRLEFSDGLNIVSLNAMRRWRPFAETGEGSLAASSAYVSAGAGLAIPHAEIETELAATYGYQYSGPAAQIAAGFNYPVNDRFSLFTEYRFTWTNVEAQLDNGWRLETDAMSHHLNVGIAFSLQGRR